MFDSVQGRRLRAMLRNAAQAMTRDDVVLEQYKKNSTHATVGRVGRAVVELGGTPGERRRDAPGRLSAAVWAVNRESREMMGVDNASHGPRTSLNSASKLLESVGFALDVATNAIVLRETPPWEYDAHNPLPRPFGRDDEIHAAKWISTQWGEDVRIDVVRNAAHAVASRHKFDSIVEAFAAPWDSIPRLNELASMLGLITAGESTGHVVEWFLQCVRRIREPGATIENILLVEGATDVRASARSIASLFPSSYVVDSGLDFDPRYAAVHKRLIGRTLVVISDFAYASPLAAELLAAFAGRARDDDDCPPRRCGFAFVSSERRDEVPTRCVPVRAGLPTAPLDPPTAAQLVAEALEASRMPSVRLGPFPRSQEDPWDIVIKGWLNTYRKDVQRHGYVATSKILRECLRIPAERWQISSHQRVARVLAMMGFERDRKRIDGGEKVYVWVPPARLLTDAEQEQVGQSGEGPGDRPGNTSEILTSGPNRAQLEESTWARTIGNDSD